MGVGGGMSGELSGVLNPPQPVVSISSLRSTGCIGRERVMDNGMHLTKDTEGDGDVEMTILSSTTSYEHTDCAINNESNTLEMQHENMSIDEDESTVKVSAKKPKKKREEKQDEHITEITTRVGRIIRPRNVYT
jgi:hypothetical protein